MPDRTFDWRPSTDPRNDEHLSRPLLATNIPRRAKAWTGPYWRIDQGSDGACFPPGTFVRMVDGSHKAIEDVRALDEVLTAEGNRGLVVGTMVRRATEVVDVGIRGHLSLTCTPEHPVLTTRGYVPAAELVADDKVAITRGFSDHQTSTLMDVWDLVDVSDLRGVLAGTINTGGVISEVAPLPALLAKTPDLGRLLGLYAAEGHVTENKVVWSYGPHERDTLVAQTVDLVKGLFEAHARIQVRPNGALNVVLYGKPWRRLFEVLVPGTAKHGTKHLSAHAADGPDEYRRAILDGWLAGDGHVRRTEINGVSVCRRLVLDMHAIANDLGLVPRLAGSAPSLNAHAATRQFRYDLTIPTGGGSNASPPAGRRAVWRAVDGVSTRRYDGWVHNLHVEADESYVADGVGVHNCVGFGWTIEAMSKPIVFRPSPYSKSDAEAFAFARYHEAQRLDEWPGEDYEGSSVNGGAKAMRAEGYITGWKWHRSVDDVIDALLTDGPQVMGSDWRSGMFTPDAGTGIIHATGGVAGGHCYCLTGYYPSWHGREVVRLRNSWGRWGQNGDAYLPVEDLRSLWSDGAEAAMPIGRSYGP